MHPVRYEFQNRDLYAMTPKGFINVSKRGRIRRALAYIGGAFLGVVMLWALCWGMAIACVVAGGSIEVCGL